MKSLYKILPVLLLVLLNYGCEPAEDPIPAVASSHFTESELADMIDLSGLIDPGSRVRVSKSYSPVIDPINGGVEVGNSLLVRCNNGIAMSLQSHQTPKHTATVWWVIFNYPENCVDGCNGADLANPDVGGEVMYAAGNVVSGKGIGKFAGKLMEGDVTSSLREAFFGLPPIGLLDSDNAEIHLVVRSHGPINPDPEILHEQLTTYGGGCEVSLPGFTQIPVNMGECADIQFAIHIAG